MEKLPLNFNLIYYLKKKTCTSDIMKRQTLYKKIKHQTCIYKFLSLSKKLLNKLLVLPMQNTNS